MLLVSSYTENTLTLVAEGACIAARQRGPLPWRSQMNFLALVQARQQKAAALQTAQRVTLVYRGVAYVKAA